MKKEHYFTEDNKEEKISEWKEILSNYYSSKRKFKFSMDHTALFIIDMQDYFLNEQSHAFVPSSRTIIKPILELKEAFKKNKKSIYYTQFGLNPELFDDFLMKRWWKGSLNTNDKMFALSPDIEVDEEDIIIVKSTYDSFVENALALSLSKDGYNKIVITGVLTHLCCESTARSAFELGFEVYLSIDCLASYNEDLHLSSLKVASHGFGIPVTSKEILESMK